MKKALLAVAALAVVAAVALGAWLVLGGEDEVTTRGTCAGNAYELSVEDDDNGLEVTYELQTAGAGETWQVRIEQGDQTLLDGTRTTDEDAELDVDVAANDTDGDEFTVTATPAEGEACTATVTR